MLADANFEEDVRRKFRVPAPTLVSRLGKSPPVVFSHVQGSSAIAEKSAISRAEDAYAVSIVLSERPVHLEMWLGNRQVDIAPVAKGGTVVAHLETEPAVRFQSDFDFIRFWISKETLDEMADESTGKLSPGLHRPDWGNVDPILFHLGSAATHLLKRRAAGDQLMIDALGVATHRHLARRYGGLPMDEGLLSLGGLAPWQERRAKEYISGNLHRIMTLQEIATECRLSVSHFSRAFKSTTGRSPHRYVLERRVDASKADLLDWDTSLSAIAMRYGFSDASHFSRVFSGVTGETPAAWRRIHGPMRIIRTN